MIMLLLLEAQSIVKREPLANREASNGKNLKKNKNDIV